MNDHPLFRAAVLQLDCTGGLGGGTVEIKDGTGTPLASADDGGTIADAQGAQLIRAPLRFDGDRKHGTNAVLDVAGADGAPLGQVRVRKYSVTPRSRKGTLAVMLGDAEVARVEPEDKKGEELAITAGERRAGTLRKTGSRGFIRKTTTYRLELTGDIEERLRPLVLATAIRYDALLNVAASAGQVS